MEGRQKDFWLNHFGIFVEPNFDCHAGGGGQVMSYKVWELRNGIPVFKVAYGDVVAKLWMTMQGMVR